MTLSCRPGVPSPEKVADAGVRLEVDATPPPPHAEPTPAAVAYFSDISQGLMDDALVSALHAKLRNDHRSLGFAGLLEAYESTDGDREGCAGIFDFYSSKCWTPAEACGDYTQEGDCFNREHSWPKAWWGGETGPDQHQDLISVIPTDGYVNNARDQLPLSKVVSASYTSSNGSARGLCASPGSPIGENCFEPPDALKGDFARIYFYVAVRYQGEFACCDEVSVTGADIDEWQETLLKKWHAADPVDLAERERNERVFALQKNRNPFVDFPVFVDRIADF